MCVCAMVKLKTIIHPKLGILLMGTLHPVNWWVTIPLLWKNNLSLDQRTSIKFKFMHYPPVN